MLTYICVTLIELQAHGDAFIQNIMELTLLEQKCCVVNNISYITKPTEALAWPRRLLTTEESQVNPCAIGGRRSDSRTVISSTIFPPLIHKYH